MEEPNIPNKVYFPPENHSRQFDEGQYEKVKTVLERVRKENDQIKWINSFHEINQAKKLGESVLVIYPSEKYLRGKLSYMSYFLNNTGDDHLNPVYWNNVFVIQANKFLLKMSNVMNLESFQSCFGVPENIGGVAWEKCVKECNRKTKFLSKDQNDILCDNLFVSLAFFSTEKFFKKEVSNFLKRKREREESVKDDGEPPKKKRKVDEIGFSDLEETDKKEVFLTKYHNFFSYSKISNSESSISEMAHNTFKNFQNKEALKFEEFEDDYLKLIDALEGKLVKVVGDAKIGDGFLNDLENVENFLASDLILFGNYVLKTGFFSHFEIFRSSIKASSKKIISENTYRVRLDKFRLDILSVFDDSFREFEAFNKCSTFYGGDSELKTGECLNESGKDLLEKIKPDFFAGFGKDGKTFPMIVCEEKTGLSQGHQQSIKEDEKQSLIVARSMLHHCMLLTNSKAVKDLFVFVIVAKGNECQVSLVKPVGVVVEKQTNSVSYQKISQYLVAEWFNFVEKPEKLFSIIFFGYLRMLEVVSKYCNTKNETTSLLICTPSKNGCPKLDVDSIIASLKEKFKIDNVHQVFPGNSDDPKFFSSDDFFFKIVSHTENSLFSSVIFPIIEKNKDCHLMLAENKIISPKSKLFPVLKMKKLSVCTTNTTMDKVLFFKFVQDLIKAVQTLHENEFLHLDVKPSNILFDGESSFYLSDFESIRMVGSIVDDGIMGTPRYCPKEQSKTGTKLTIWFDYYAVGKTIQEIVEINEKISVDANEIIQFAKSLIETRDEKILDTIVNKMVKICAQFPLCQTN